MLEAQSLISQGISCIVGTGQNIDILNSLWLPLVEDPYVHTFNETLVNQKVASLLQMGERAWDVDLINDVFNERDVDLIISIPLGGSDSDSDIWYRRHDKMGNYSVKSAYICLQNAKRNSTSADNSGF